MDAVDTIAAVSTPAGEGGVAVVRISGPDALKTARAVFSPSSSSKAIDAATPWTPTERYLHYGTIKNPEHGSTIDDGFLAYMLGPRSYTGEDVVEIHCHGGSLVTTRVLESVLAAGARLAEPGEFTKRAFVNGRMDLARAEAVIDVIRAETDGALASARGRLDGQLSKKVNDAKEALTGVLARTEAELDFPEEEEVERMPAHLVADAVVEPRAIIERLIESFREGSALRDGVRTVILGRPNVGKSSLLNLLLNEERAIVTPMPGTTRDVIEEVISVHGLPARLMDTAGLRDTTDVVESIGVERSKERARSAQVVLFVVDASSNETATDISILGSIEEGQGGEVAGRTIVVANKVDLAIDPASLKDRLNDAFFPRPVAFVSALRDEGTDELKELFYATVTGHRPGLGVEGGAGARPVVPAGEIVTSLRHRRALETALECVERAAAAVEGPDGPLNGPLTDPELIATDLRGAVDRLGEITGETTTDDILERIFSEFCIGK